MTFLNINNSNLLSKFNFFCLLLFVFWLPLKDDFLPAILSLWIFSWLLELRLKNKMNLQVFDKKIYFAIGLYFILTVIALFYSKNLSDGAFEIQIKLSLIFFPIILFTSNDSTKKGSKYMLIIFIIGNLFASFYCLINAIVESLVLKNGCYVFHFTKWASIQHYSFWKLVNLRLSHFSYINISKFMHPSYFSMYITFSIVVIINFFRNGLIKKKYLIILYSILIIFFIFMLYLLQSRAAFLTFGVVIILIPIVELHKKLKKRFIFLTIAMLLAAITFVLTSNRIKANIHDLSSFIKSENKTELLKSDIRLQLWYTSIKVIEEHLWIGTSPANLNDELVKKYKELGFDQAANDNLNSHNQYLETFAGLGIFGFLSLLYIIIYTFIISIKERKYLLFFLMVILSINFLFEAMLNRMAGVLFMMFFISLLVFTKEPLIKSDSTDIKANEVNEDSGFATSN